MRAGPKWYYATGTDVLGANIYDVIVHDLDITWKYHVQQLLAYDRSNMQHNDLNVKPAGVPIEDIPECDVSIPNVTDTNNVLNCPEQVNNDPMELYQSTRIRKPVERIFAGSVAHATWHTFSSLVFSYH